MKKTISVTLKVLAITVMVILGFPFLITGFWYAFVKAVFLSGKKIYDEDFQEWLD